MDNPFAGTAPKANQADNPFAAGANPFAATGNPFASGANPFGSSNQGDELSNRVSALEQAVAESGAPSPEQDSPGLFRRTVDILSRPNYAVAGAAGELVQGHGIEAAAKRAGTEFFSGIGGLQGKKEGFGQVLEQAGVGKLGSLSDIAPFLYSDTGEGLPLQKGGWADITGRGVGGFVLDVALDPTTYLTVGTGKAAQLGGKGIVEGEKAAQALRAVRFAGLPVPGSAKALELMTNASKATIKAVPAFDKAADAVGKVFNRDWRIRNLPGAIEAKQAHLNRLNLETAIVDDALEHSKIAAIPRKERAAFFDAIDQGTWEKDYADKPELLAAAQEVTAMNAKILKDDIEAGLLAPHPQTVASLERRIEEARAGLSSTNPEYLSEVTRLEKERDALFQAKPADTIKRFAVQPDEVTTFRRRGFDIEQTQTGKFVATKSTPPLGREIAKWESGLREIDTQIGRLHAENAAEIRKLQEQLVGAKASLADLPNTLGRANYIGHFYENSPEELSRVVAVWPGATPRNQASIGRHAELRVFDTVKQAEEWSTKMHSIDPTIPILRPIRDPLKVMQWRAHASIQGREWLKYYAEIEARWAKKELPFDAKEFFDLTREVPTSAGEAAKIESLVKAGKTPLQEFNALSAAGRQEFVRQRLLKSGTQEEAIAALKKYGIENAPKQTSLLGKLAEDGSPYVSVNIPAIKSEIPKSMADDLADMSERVLKSRELDHLLRYYDKINNTFKSMVTVLFPAFHFRNAYSNLAQGFADVGMSVLNPARHYDAYAALRGLEGALTTKAGEVIPYKQLAEEMAQQGVLTTGRRTLEYTGTQGLDRLSTVGGKIKAAPRAVGGAIENEARAALYTVYRRRGMDAVSAGERVNQFLYDYTNLSQVEKDVFRRIIPFYTFTRKNLERQFRNIATKPGLTLAELKGVRGREDENGQMTGWEGEALKFRLNRDGQTLRVITGVDLPVRQLDYVWNGSIRSTLRQAMGMLSPILKAPIEIAGGTSLFTGKDMTRQQSQAVGKAIEFLDPPKGVKDWMGYVKSTDAAGRPRYSFDGERFYMLFQAYAISRIVSTSDRQFRTWTSDPSAATVLLDMTTGLRYKELNLDEEQQKRMKERIDQLQKSAIRRGILREGSYTYRPKQ